MGCKIGSSIGTSSANLTGHNETGSWPDYAEVTKMGCHSTSSFAGSH